MYDTYLLTYLPSGRSHCVDQDGPTRYRVLAFFNSDCILPKLTQHSAVSAAIRWNLGGGQREVMLTAQRERCICGRRKDKYAADTTEKYYRAPELGLYIERMHTPADVFFYSLQSK